MLGPRIATVCALAILVPSLAGAAEKAPLVFSAIGFEELEYRFGDDTDLVTWDGDASIGTDEDKLRLRSKGEYAFDPRAFEKLETQLLYQSLLTDFFDVKLGVRADTPENEDDRLYGVLGIQGLAPQWLEVDADFFVNTEGDASLRLDTEYELLLTNGLILVSSLEFDIALSDDREIGVGRGLSSGELGFRLSYDLYDRTFSPYVGIIWKRLFGDTGDLAQEEGEDDDAFFLVVGVRLLF
ncbi:MAG: copper resistance protein B [Geminicoccaceae bacterium]|nr:copper resistance protein B [Geminicoccaceae bacterium]